MAGIYIHIPFCKKACSYCDFHFSTQLKNKTELINCLIQELELRRNYLDTKEINSIYFGGGTPSLLNKEEIDRLLNQVHKQYSVHPDAEICLEANPDDLNRNSLKELAITGINRLSIGVQSFHKEELLFMNRAHTASESLKCIKTAQDSGFSNLSIDLIFGSPISTIQSWEENLKIFFDLDLPHLSAYSLTVEEGTKLHHDIQNQKTPKLEDQLAFEQYQLLQNLIDENGYQQYEVSNYCKEDMFALHNSNYWNQSHYIGIGPSAHSYNGISRQWNIANNAIYMKGIRKEELPFEIEDLTEKERYQDYLITSLRTNEGLSLKVINEQFSKEINHHFKQKCLLLPDHLIKKHDDRICLKREKLFLSDEVIRILW